MGLSSILIIPLHGLQPKHSAWGAGGGGVIEGCLCWVFLAVWAFSSFSEQALHSSCGARASRWEAQPQAPRVCGFQLLQRVGLVVAIQELSYSAACGIFPDQGSNLCLPHWQADSLPLRHVGSPGKVV